MLVFDRALTVEERTRGSRCVLRVSGELDMASASQLETLVRARAASHREVVLELDALSFVDSIGIRAILSGYDACRALGHLLVATGASAQVRRVLETCGLIDTPPFAPDTARSASSPLSAVGGATRARPPRRGAAGRAGQPRPSS